MEEKSLSLAEFLDMRWRGVDAVIGHLVPAISDHLSEQVSSSPSLSSVLLFYVFFPVSKFSSPSSSSSSFQSQCRPSDQLVSVWSCTEFYLVILFSSFIMGFTDDNEILNHIQFIFIVTTPELRFLEAH